MWEKPSGPAVRSVESPTFAEPRAFVSNLDCEGLVSEAVSDVDALGLVHLIAVLDGVDDAFADGDADPVNRVFVQADVAADVAAHDFDEIHHVEGAGELEPDAQGMLRNHWMRMEYHPICEMMSS